MRKGKVAYSASKFACSAGSTGRGKFERENLESLLEKKAEQLLEKTWRSSWVGGARNSRFFANTTSTSIFLVRPVWACLAASFPARAKSAPQRRDWGYDDGLKIQVMMEVWGGIKFTFFLQTRRLRRFFGAPSCADFATFLENFKI